MHKVNALDFQVFSSRLGCTEFFRGFYYFKWLEYPLVYNSLDIQKGEQYLDLGSGKSIFPIFSLLKNNCTVHIIDDLSIIKDSAGYYQDTLKKMNLNNLINRRFFIHAAAAGSTSFDFPDNYFDKISCISTLEHIRDSGDSKIMVTMARILKKGGIAALSFPFNREKYIEEENPLGVGYFQRQYNKSEIKRRIIEPSGLKVKKVIYFGERYVSFGRFYRRNKLNKINWLLPLFAPIFWRIGHSYEDGFRDFCEPQLEKDGTGVACVVLQK